VPETATVLLAAGELLAVTSPENDPAEAPVKRTYTVLLATEPPEGVNEIELA
jgi:hypothetical protein